jgi:hypothetical protein
VTLAEYRLAMTHLALGEPEGATTHARRALALCDENEAGPGDRAFPLLALSRARHEAGDAVGAREALSAARDGAAALADEGLQSSAAAEIAALESLVG